jgi:hypothetical protein
VIAIYLLTWEGDVRIAPENRIGRLLSRQGSSSVPCATRARVRRVTLLTPPRDHRVTFRSRPCGPSSWAATSSLRVSDPLSSPVEQLSRRRSQYHRVRPRQRRDRPAEVCITSGATEGLSRGAMPILVCNLDGARRSSSHPVERSRSHPDETDRQSQPRAKPPPSRGHSAHSARGIQRIFARPLTLTSRGFMVGVGSKRTAW